MDRYNTSKITMIDRKTIRENPAAYGEILNPKFYYHKETGQVYMMIDRAIEIDKIKNSRFNNLYTPTKLKELLSEDNRQEWLQENQK